MWTRDQPHSFWPASPLGGVISAFAREGGTICRGCSSYARLHRVPAGSLRDAAGWQGSRRTWELIAGGRLWGWE